MSPDILVIDEPSSNLDPLSRRNLIDLLKTFSHTKIIATHDLDMVLDLCERTIVLREGRVAADGKTLELLRNDRLMEESHLERPYRLAAMESGGGRDQLETGPSAVRVGCPRGTKARRSLVSVSSK